MEVQCPDHYLTHIQLDRNLPLTNLTLNAQSPQQTIPIRAPTQMLEVHPVYSHV